MADAIYEEDPLMIQETLEEWVITKCENWRDYYESNYEARFEEYYRLWRGQWDPADSDRVSERSRIISPALQQAVESNVAELEEATFGRGKWFDIADDVNDKERQDVQYLRKKLTEDLIEITQNTVTLKYFKVASNANYKNFFSFFVLLLALLKKQKLPENGLDAELVAIW